jgi:hypothetical protein
MKEPMDKIQYNFISPDLPQKDLDEALSILESLDSRKADKVNWEERAQMNEISKRSGKYLMTEENAKKESKDDHQEKDIEQKEIKEEKVTKYSPNEKEKNLLGYLDGVMNLLEEIDDKR